MPPSCLLSVRTVPGASREGIDGWVDGELKVRVRAPAQDGRANEALCKLLASRLMIPPRALVLVRGAKSRHKVVRVDGLDATEAAARLGPAA
jgi:uncharacterized protein (TIGR00251 family)